MLVSKVKLDWHVHDQFNCNLTIIVILVLQVTMNCYVMCIVNANSNCYVVLTFNINSFF